MTRGSGSATGGTASRRGSAGRAPPGGRRRRVGPRGAAAAALALLVATAGCVYGFSGGGGLPEHIETIYVPPVKNQTTRFALSERVTQRLLDAVGGRLGAQTASENRADAVIRVTLTDYSDEALSFEAQEDVGADVFQRRVTLVASVEIEDRVRDNTMWSSASVRGTGEYAPEQEREDVAVEIAVEDLVQRIVNGAQAQW